MMTVRILPTKVKSGIVLYSCNWWSNERGNISTIISEWVIKSLRRENRSELPEVLASDDEYRRGFKEGYREYNKIATREILNAKAEYALYEYNMKTNPTRLNNNEILKTAVKYAIDLSRNTLIDNPFERGYSKEQYDAFENQRSKIANKS